MNFYLEQQAWESAFFGREIYRLNFSEQVTENSALPTNGLVQAKVPTADVAQCNKLQQLGFALVESEVTFALPRHKMKLVHTTFDALIALQARHIRRATVQDIATLQAQFGGAFQASRFAEPYFTVAENQRFYRQWIENAVNGTFDHLCWVEEERANGTIHGFISLRREENHAVVGLLAVAENSRRQGVAGRLLEQAQTWANAEKVGNLRISTQLRNTAAINCYLAQGAQLCESHYWFYKRSI